METQLKATCTNKGAFITQPGTGKLLVLAGVCATGVFQGLHGITPAPSTDSPSSWCTGNGQEKGRCSPSLPLIHHRAGEEMMRAHVGTTLPLSTEHLPSALGKMPGMLLPCTRLGTGERISSHITHWKEQQERADPISGS